MKVIVLFERDFNEDAYEEVIEAYENEGWRLAYQTKSTYGKGYIVLGKES